MENEIPTKPTIDEETKSKIDIFMSYFMKIKENGALDIFTQLFQTDFRIMAYLESHPDAHPSVMADVLNVTRPNIAANLRLLEQKGYIQRIIDENNRRQVYVNLTEEGKRYISLVSVQLSVLFASWLQILGEEESEHLFKILEISSNPALITENLKSFSFGS